MVLTRTRQRRPGGPGAPLSAGEGGSGSGALLGALVLHVGAEHRVDLALIAVAVGPEPSQDVLIEADADRLLGRWLDDAGLLEPRLVGQRRRIGIAAHSGLDVGVGLAIHPRPVGLRCPGRRQRAPRRTLVSHVCSPFLPK